jgi:hypothetical protein
VTNFIIDTPAHSGGCIFYAFGENKMQTKRPLKDFTTERITELIEARAEMIYGLQVEIKDLTDELEARQDPNRPVQLELF